MSLIFTTAVLFGAGAGSNVGSTLPAGSGKPISVNALETTAGSTPAPCKIFAISSLSVGLPAYFQAFSNLLASTLLPVMPNNSLI